MGTKKRYKPQEDLKKQENLHSDVEEILEKKLEDITTVLADSHNGNGNGKSRLHEEVMSMVEKGLFKIALRRSSNIKSAAATFLGMNRNTFTDKMAKLGIDSEKSK